MGRAGAHFNPNVSSISPDRRWTVLRNLPETGVHGQPRPFPGSAATHSNTGSEDTERFERSAPQNHRALPAYIWLHMNSRGRLCRPCAIFRIKHLQQRSANKTSPVVWCKADFRPAPHAGLGLGLRSH